MLVILVKVFGERPTDLGRLAGMDPSPTQELASRHAGVGRSVLVSVGTGRKSPPGGEHAVLGEAEPLLGRLLDGAAGRRSCW